MITKPSGLLVFLNTFCAQKEKDQKKKFHPTEAIARIKEVSDFIEDCEIEIREVAGIEQASDRILQGPDGVCSAQTTRGIKLKIQTLQRISSTLEDRRPVSSVGRAPVAVREVAGSNLDQTNNQDR